MKQYEIEMKVLLGSADMSAKFLEAAKKHFPGISKVSEESQLNHYFVGTVTQKIADAFEGKIEAQKLDSLRHLIEEWKDFSIRSRFVAPSKTILVFKVAMGEGGADHAIIREEWEVELPDISIETLDKMLLDTGLIYLSKWSRERETYATHTGVNVCMEKNAGYGYVAEVEKVIYDESQAESAKEEIKKLVREFGFEVLDPERLARMFKHYNANWRDYYGTDNVFNIH